MNKSVFFLESPLQIISSYEYIQEKKVSSYRIFIRKNNSSSNNKQTLNTVNELGLGNIEYVEISRGLFRNLFNFKLFLIFLNALFSKTIFLGDLNSYFSKIITTIFFWKNYIVLDDGISIFWDSKKVKHKKNFKFFSSFLNGNDYDLEENSFKHLKKKYSGVASTECSVFLGSDAASLGQFKEKYYKEMIQSAILSASKKFYFFSHRNEKKFSKLDINEKVEVKKINIPIELYLKKNGLKPIEIFTCYSSGGFTLKKIFPESRIKFSIPYENYIRKDILQIIKIESRNSNIQLDVF